MSVAKRNKRTLKRRAARQRADEILDAIALKVLEPTPDTEDQPIADIGGAQRESAPEPASQS